MFSFAKGRVGPGSGENDIKLTWVAKNVVKYGKIPIGLKITSAW